MISNQFLNEIPDLAQQITDLKRIVAEKELMLSLSSDISHIKAKKELMQLIREKFQRLFYFYHCTIVVNSDDKSTFKAFLLDPNSKMKMHDNYNRIITTDYKTEDGLVDVIQASETPVIFNLDHMVASGRAPEYIIIMHNSGIKQLMGIALQNEGQMIGVLSFYSDLEENFNPKMFPVIRGIVGQISLAVVNLMAAETLENRIKEREILLSISSAIASVKDKNSLLEVINSNLRQLFYFTHSVTLQLSSDDQYMTAFLLDPSSLSKTEPNYNEVVSSRIAVHDGIIDKLLENHAPLLFDIQREADRSDAPDYIKMNHNAGLKELLSVTLRIADRKPLGIICLYSDRRGSFESEVLNLVQGVAYHISTAMANILHHEEIRIRENEKSVLLSLSNYMAQARKKNDLEQVMRRELKKIFYFSHSSIVLFSNDKKTYQNFVGDDRIEKEDNIFDVNAQNSNYPFDFNSCSILRASGPILLDLYNLEQSGQLPDILRSHYESGIRQSISVGLRNEGEIFGILTFYSDKKESFCDNHIEIINGVGSQIAIAVANIIANENIERNEKDTQILLTLSADMDKVKDRNDLLHIVKSKLTELISFADVAITLYNAESKTFQVFAHQVMDKRENHPKFQSVISPSYPVYDGIHEVALQADGPVMVAIEDAMKSPNKHHGTQFIYESGIKKMLLVKLTNNQEVIGFINILSEKVNAFDEINLTILKGITDQLSTAISNVLSLEEIKRRDHENEILLGISNALSSVREKKTLMYEIKQHLRTSLTFADICISYYNTERDTYTIFARENEKSSQHPDFEKIVAAEFPIQDGMHNVTMVSDCPVVFDFEKLSAMKMPHIDFIIDTGIREVACIRLKNKDEVIGALVLLSDKDHSFSKNDVSLIERVSHHLATAVCNILANEELTENEREKALLLSEKSQLLSFSSDITSVRDKSELSRIIFERLREMINYDEFVIAMMDEKGLSHYPYLHVFADDSKAHPMYSRMSTVYFPVNDGFFDQVIKASNPVVFDLSILVESGTAPEYLRFDYENGIREIVGVPLEDGNKILGAFFILLKDPGNWDEPILRLVQGISYQLSIAIANLLANTKIEMQLAEINKYKKQLEEEKLYLQEEASLGYSYNDIIGSTPQMQRVFHLLSQVSFTNTTVLLLGETGTGKELIARAIHNSSSRKDKLMVKVNCAALPASLIESELFGHERGSFTGATERRLGKFELANHGTLFLDEIGEMPLDLQVKLLRALQEREIERVGGKATIKVDVRIVAATNRNLQKEVAEGKFRSDLYYRLNVFPITLPSLREHKDDIPVLAQHFLSKYAKNNGRKAIQISSNAMKELMAYNWPGNVRELEHLIERSILMSNGNTVRDMHLPKLRSEEAKVQPEDVYPKTHEENEREYIIQVLNRCNGKIFGSGGAAEIMDMKVGTLNSRMKKLGIRKEQTVFKKA